jgi:hypothetical protein
MKNCLTLSLPGPSRQSMITANAHFAPVVVMDARNMCGHDRKGLS